FQNRFGVWFTALDILTADDAAKEMSHFPAIEKWQGTPRGSSNAKAQPPSMQVTQQFNTARNGSGLVVITLHPVVHASIDDTFKRGGRVRIVVRKKLLQRCSIAKAHQLVDPLFSNRRSTSEFEHLKGNLVEKSD